MVYRKRFGPGAIKRVGEVEREGTDTLGCYGNAT